MATPLTNFRAPASEKKVWVRAAKKGKETLSEFLRRAANTEAAAVLNGSGPAVPSQPRTTSQRKTRAAAPQTSAKTAPQRSRAPRSPRERPASRAAKDQGASSGASSPRASKRTYQPDFKKSAAKKP